MLHRMSRIFILALQLAKLYNYINILRERKRVH